MRNNEPGKNEQNGALALTAVSALLCGTLEEGFSKRNLTQQLGGSPEVSALPPDRLTDRGEERPGANVFLYQMTPNISLRHDSLNPSADALKQGWSVNEGDAAMQARQNRPLGLDLHYLLSFYGSRDGQMETLMGHAAQILQAATLWREEEIKAQIHDYSQHIAASGGAAERFTALATAADTAALFNSIRELQITPQFLPMEEMAKLWAMLQAKYRPSFCLRVSRILLAG